MAAAVEEANRRCTWLKAIQNFFPNGKFRIWVSDTSIFYFSGFGKKKERKFYQKKEGRERGKVGDSTGKRQFINLLKFYQKKEGRERGRVSDSIGKKAVY